MQEVKCFRCERKFNLEKEGKQIGVLLDKQGKPTSIPVYHCGPCASLSQEERIRQLFK